MSVDMLPTDYQGQKDLELDLGFEELGASDASAHGDVGLPTQVELDEITFDDNDGLLAATLASKGGQHDNLGDDRHDDHGDDNGDDNGDDHGQTHGGDYDSVNDQGDGHQKDYDDEDDTFAAIAEPSTHAGADGFDISETIVEEGATFDRSAPANSVGSSLADKKGDAEVGAAFDVEIVGEEQTVVIPNAETDDVASEIDYDENDDAIEGAGNAKASPTKPDVSTIDANHAEGDTGFEEEHEQTKDAGEEQEEEEEAHPVTSEFQDEASVSDGDPGGRSPEEQGISMAEHDAEDMAVEDRQGELVAGDDSTSAQDEELEMDDDGILSLEQADASAEHEVESLSSQARRSYDVDNTTDYMDDGSQHASMDEDSSAPPNVKVQYRETTYSLFSTSGSDDPYTYFLSDVEALDFPLSQFLDSLREVISEDLSPADELLFRVEGLGLEFSETMDRKFLDRTTFGNIVDLHDRLMKNDDPTEESQELVIFLVTRPNCIRRLETLFEGARSGQGLSTFRTSYPHHLTTDSRPNSDAGRSASGSRSVSEDVDRGDDGGDVDDGEDGDDGDDRLVEELSVGDLDQDAPAPEDEEDENLEQDYDLMGNSYDQVVNEAAQYVGADSGSPGRATDTEDDHEAGIEEIENIDETLVDETHAHGLAVHGQTVQLDREFEQLDREFEKAGADMDQAAREMNRGYAEEHIEIEESDAEADNDELWYGEDGEDVEGGLDAKPDDGGMGSKAATPRPLSSEAAQSQHGEDVSHGRDQSHGLDEADELELWDNNEDAPQPPGVGQAADLSAENQSNGNSAFPFSVSDHFSPTSLGLGAYCPSELSYDIELDLYPQQDDADLPLREAQEPFHTDAPNLDTHSPADVTHEERWDRQEDPDAALAGAGNDTGTHTDAYTDENTGQAADQFSHEFVSEQTSASGTLNGDEIDFDDSLATHPPVENIAQDDNENLHVSDDDGGTSQRFDPDEIDWEDNDEAATAAPDAINSTPSSNPGKRNRELDDAEGSGDGHDVKRLRA